MEKINVDIFNEDGSLKSKEDFLKTFDKAYDEIAEEIKGADVGLPDTYFGILTDPEC